MADSARGVQEQNLSTLSANNLPPAEDTETVDDGPAVATAAAAATNQDPGDNEEDDDPDDDAAGAMPLTLAASVVLTALPQDAHAALEGAGDLAQEKVTVRFQPVGSAPQLRQRVFKISSRQRFAAVVSFLRRKLGVQKDESVFCYVNNVFAPGLDEGVGNLWRCFKTGDELVVAYAKTPAFG